MGTHKLIATEFDGRSTQKGWKFRLLHRDGKYAIFKKTSESMVYYEVVVLRVQKARTVVFGGKAVDYPEQEIYPRDEEFGLYGWSYGNMEKAMAKYMALVLCQVIDLPESTESKVIG